jgi:arsenate reductase
MPAAHPTVLFLCADNSIRSQLGEALLRHRAGARFVACSAGLAPKPVHPLVRQVLHEIGLDEGELTSKPVGPFLGKRSVRYAVILRAPNEPNAPRIFPFAARTIRWEVGDPEPGTGPDDDVLERFRHVRDDIDVRVRAWVAEMDESDRSSSAA